MQVLGMVYADEQRRWTNIDKPCEDSKMEMAWMPCECSLRGKMQGGHNLRLNHFPVYTGLGCLCISGSLAMERRSICAQKRNKIENNILYIGNDWAFSHTLVTERRNLRPGALYGGLCPGERFRAQFGDRFAPFSRAQIQLILLKKKSKLFLGERGTKEASSNRNPNYYFSSGSRLHSFRAGLDPVNGSI